MAALCCNGSLLNDVVHIVIENRPILGTSNISIFLTSSDGMISCMSVTVQQSIIILKFYSEDELCSSVKLVFANIKFIPLSCGGLTGIVISPDQFESFKVRKLAQSGLEISFHVQILSDAKCMEEECVSLLARDSTTSNIIFDMTQICTKNSQNIVDLSPVTHRYLQCKFCLESFFISPKYFKKVLELPSENWEELSSDWFCHRHDENIVGALFDCQLLSDNLLVSALYYKLNCELLSNVSYDANEIYCKRCYNRIGMLQNFSNSKIKIAVILKSKIIFNEQENKCKSNVKNKTDSIKIMTHLIEKYMCTAASCKICFDSKPEQIGEKGTCLLIWVMDSRLTRYYTSLPITRSSSEHYLDVTLSSVIRVLFGIAPRDSAQASSWKKDFSIEVEEVDQDALWSFIKHLVESSKSVSPSHRFVDKLMIGYLLSCS